MIWVLIFAGIAVLSLVLLVCYAVWLWHKLSDLMSEFELISKRAAECAALLQTLDLTPLEARASLPSEQVDNISATDGRVERVSVDTDA